MTSTDISKDADRSGAADPDRGFVRRDQEHLEHDQDQRQCHQVTQQSLTRVAFVTNQKQL